MICSPISQTPETATEARCVEKALDWLVHRQHRDGSWEAEVIWCPMILAQYVIMQRMLNQAIDEQTCKGIIRHFEVTRRKGVGWGLHAESEPYVFVTTLAYIALRFLGLAPDEPLTASARAWLWTQ